MPLESTVIVLDASEFTRNGDYVPSRMEAMRDAVHCVCQVKMNMNAENTVGLVSCGGPHGAKVLASCTQDMALLLNTIAGVRVGGGEADFSRALQVSALALKHRRNKTGGQRVVAFVCSPVTDDEGKLVKLAKSLKKNNVAVDVVAVGELEANEAKLKSFVEAVDKGGNSHLISVPAGVLPSDVLMSSSILTGGEEGAGGLGGLAGAGGAAGDAFAEYGGDDPFLAMALRASMEEERARLSAAAAATTTTTTEASSSSADAAVTQKPANVPAEGSLEADEEEMLRQALLMSISDSGEAATSASAAAAGPDAPQGVAASAPATGPDSTAKKSSAAASEAGADAQGEEGGGDDDDDEDAKALALALAMSQEQDDDAAPAQSTSAPASAAPPPAQSTSAPASAAPPPASVAAAPASSGGGGAPTEFMDPSFVSELLEGLEGVDLNDPSIKALLASMGTDAINAAARGNAGDKPDTKKQKKDEGES